MAKKNLLIIGIVVSVIGLLLSLFIFLIPLNLTFGLPVITFADLTHVSNPISLTTASGAEVDSVPIGAGLITKYRIGFFISVLEGLPSDAQLQVDIIAYQSSGGTPTTLIGTVKSVTLSDGKSFWIEFTEALSVNFERVYKVSMQYTTQGAGAPSTITVYLGVFGKSVVIGYSGAGIFILGLVVIGVSFAVGGGSTFKGARKRGKRRRVSFTGEPVLGVDLDSSTTRTRRVKGTSSKGKKKVVKKKRAAARPAATAAATTTCRYCGKPVSPTALICPHCYAELR